MLSIISTPLFLIAQSKITYPSPPKSKQVIGTNREVYQIFLALLFLQQVTSLSNRCTFAFGQPSGWDFIPATDLELNRFRPLPVGELVWHLRTRGNNGLLDAYINIFDPRRGKFSRFIHYLFYSMVYPSISSNLVTLYTLSHWYDSVCTHTLSPFLS